MVLENHWGAGPYNGAEDENKLPRYKVVRATSTLAGPAAARRC